MSCGAAVRGAGGGSCRLGSRFCLIVELVKGWDYPVEAVLGAAKVVCEPELPVAVGTGNEGTVDGCLLAVDVEELGGGLEVGAVGQTGAGRLQPSGRTTTTTAGAGVGTLLLGWPLAVAIGQAVALARGVLEFWVLTRWRGVLK